MTDTKTIGESTKKESCVETRIKKLELLNPGRSEEMQLFFQTCGLSNASYYRLKSGLTKGRLIHKQTTDKMVVELNLLEE